MLIACVGILYSIDTNAQVTKKKINVDGSADDWSTIGADTVGTPDGTDLTVSYKMAWDDENLYLLFQVEDDTAAVLGREPYETQDGWAVDNIELFFDMDNSDSVWVSGGAKYDGKNDMQLRFHRDTLVEIGTAGWPNTYGTIPDLPNSPGVVSDTWGTSYQQGFAGMGVTVVSKETENGYIMEIGLPFSFLLAVDPDLDASDFMAGTEIGFGIQVRDMDAVGEHMTIKEPADLSWKDPSGWATITLADATEPVTIKAVNQTITIDGDAADWASIDAYNLGEDNSPDLAITYKLARDNHNLYVLFEVEDDTAAVLGRGDYSAQPGYHVDNIELFLDMDNSKNVWVTGGAAYDDNDYQLRFHRDTLVEVGASGWPNTYGTIPGLPNEPGVDSEVWGTDYQTGFEGLGLSIELVETAQGYMQEIAIPLNFLTAADDNLTPADLLGETEVGVRLQVRDMDAVGEQMAIDYPLGSHWKKPNTWSTLILEDASEEVAVPKKKINVDGSPAEWNTIPGHSLADNGNDLTVDYKLAWDDENLYFLFEVLDDTAAVLGRGDYAGEGSWAVDNIELFLDMDNSKNFWVTGGAAYDDNDFQLRIHRDTLVEVGASGWPNTYGTIPGLPNEPGVNSEVWGTDYQAGFAGLGLTIVEVKTDTSYRKEIAVPFTFLTKADENMSPADFMAGSEIGLRVQVRDMDAVGEHMASDFPSGSHWKKPLTWATMVLQEGTEPAGVDAAFKSITVDGDYSDWADIDGYNLGEDNSPDLAISYKLARDADNLYVMFDVKDDTAAVLGRGDYAGEGSWAVDNIELFLDMDNSKNIWITGGAAYDDNDYQLRFHRDTLVEVGASGWPNTYGTIPRLPNEPGVDSEVWGTDYQQGFAGLGVLIDQTETADGYMKEIAIPFSFLTKADDNLNPADFMKETEVGIRVQVRDMDAVGEQMAIDYPLGSHWKKPDTWGTLTLEAATPPSMITLDGEIDDLWSKAPAFEIATIVEPEKHPPWNVENEDDLSGYFKVLWDANYLYLLGVVKDDTLVHTDGSHIVDRMGVYIDPENSKNLTDPGLLSVTATFGVDGTKSGRTQPGWGNPPSYEYVLTPNDTGYVAEFLIPVESIRSPLMAAGTMIGIDLILNDVDDPASDDRDLMAWNSAYDLLYQDAFYFGTIELLADSTVMPYMSPDVPANFAASVIGDDGDDVQLTWNEVAGVDGYHIISSFGGDRNPIEFVETVEGGATTSVTIEDLDDGHYEYYLVAHAEGDVISAPNENSVTFDIITTDIDDIQSDKFKVYPNPVSAIMTIEGQGIQSVEIIDVTGRVALSKRAGNQVESFQLDISSLESGAYSVRIKVNDVYVIRNIIKN